MKSITDSIKQEIFINYKNNIISKLNKIYISGDYNDILNINIEFIGFNGSKIIIRLQTKENTSNIYNNNLVKLKEDLINIENRILNFEDIKLYFTYLISLQLKNISYLINRIKLNKENDMSNLINILKKSEKDSEFVNDVDKNINNLKDTLKLLKDKNVYDKYENNKIIEDNDNMENIKLKIMSYLKIPTDTSLKDRFKLDYLTKLKVLVNLINESIILHYYKDVNDYLERDGICKANDLYKYSQTIDPNIYIINEEYTVYKQNTKNKRMYNISYIGELNYVKLIDDLKLGIYGKNTQNLFSNILYNMWIYIQDKVCNVIPIKEKYIKIKNLFIPLKSEYIFENFKNILTIDNTLYSYINFEIIIYLFTKLYQTLMLDYTDEILNMNPSFDKLKMTIYDFEVYHSDFNVSTINTTFGLINDKFKYIKKLENEKSKSKDEIKKLSASLDEENANDRLDIVNDVFKLNKLCSNTNLLIGFNSFNYDNSILFGILYNLHNLKIDITNISINDDDLNFLNDYILTSNDKESESFKKHYYDVEKSKFSNERLTSDHCLKKGSILYNLNNAIIGKDFKLKSKNDKATNLIQYLTYFLKIILKFKKVDVITSNIDDIMNTSDNIEYTHRLLNNKELEKFRFAYSTGYKNIMAIDVQDEIGENFVSLKSIEGYLGLSIEEFEDFTIQHKLSEEQMNKSVMYCRHDVYATYLTFLKRFDFYLSKFEMLELFKLNYKNINNTRLGIVTKGLKILGKINYNDILNLSYVDALENINYKNNPYNNNDSGFKALYDIKQNFDNIRDTYNKEKENNPKIYKSLQDSELSYKLMDVDHTIRFGGIHGSRNQTIYIGHIIAADVGSYYPSLMIMYNFMSRSSLDNLSYPKLFLERMNLKAEKNPKQQIYKIALNAMYGSLKAIFSNCYDPVQANNICINGQLALIDLIARLNTYTNVIQSNTDGIYISYGKNERINNKIKEIFKTWENDYKLSLEADVYKGGIIQVDVNQYILFKLDENNKPYNIKCKGSLFKKYNKGVDIPPFQNTKRYIDQIITEYYLYKAGVNPNFGLNCNNEKDMIKRALINLKNEDISALQQITKVGSYEYTIHNVIMNKEDLIAHILNNYNIKLNDSEFDNLNELLHKYHNIFDSIKVNDDGLFEAKLILQRVNRLFATNNPKLGCVENVKFIMKDGQIEKSYSKIALCPEKVVVYNKALIGENIDVDKIIEFLDIDINEYVNVILDKIIKANVKPIQENKLLESLNADCWYKVTSDHITSHKEKQLMNNNTNKLLKDIKIINDNSDINLFKQMKKILNNLTTIKSRKYNEENINSLLSSLDNFKNIFKYNDILEKYMNDSITTISNISYNIIKNLNENNKFNIKIINNNSELKLLISTLSSYIKYIIDLSNDNDILKNEYILSIISINKYIIENNEENLIKTIKEFTLNENYNHSQYKINFKIEPLKFEIIEKIIDRIINLVKLTDNSFDNNCYKNNNDIIKQEIKDLNNKISLYLKNENKYTNYIKEDIKSSLQAIYVFENLINNDNMVNTIMQYKNSHHIIRLIENYNNDKNVNIIDTDIFKFYMNIFIKQINKNLNLIN